MPEQTEPLQRKILHVDADAFYCSVEEREDPGLKGKAFAVGGRAQSRGVIATCSYAARQSGVHSAMATGHALRLCPELMVLPARFDIYREASRQMHAIFRRYTDRIEPLSLDEAYLDVSHSDRCQGSGTLMARQIMQSVQQEVGISVSVGVAPNKFLAKVASDWNKPRGLCVITPDQVQDFVFQLPVGKIYGVGKVTADKLHQKGITTCGMLRQYSPAQLCDWFGSFGAQLWELSHGLDERPLELDRRRKSLSVEHTYDQDLPDESSILAQVAPLIEELSHRFETIKADYCATGRFVKVKFSDFTQTTLEEMITRAGQAPEAHFHDLLIHAWQRGNKPVRLLGVGVRLQDLRSAEQTPQLELFDSGAERIGRL